GVGRNLKQALLYVALGFIARLELLDLTVECLSFGRGLERLRLQCCRLSFSPNPLGDLRNSPAQSRSNALSCIAILLEQSIEQNHLSSKLSHFPLACGVRAVRACDEQAEHKGSQRSHNAHAQFYDLFSELR